MRVRQMTYKHYGMTQRQAHALVDFCRSAGFPYRDMVEKAAQEVYPYLKDALVRCICDGLSWRDLWDEVNLEMHSFYAYRKKCCCILWHDMKEKGVLPNSLLKGVGSNDERGICRSGEKRRS